MFQGKPALPSGQDTSVSAAMYTAVLFAFIVGTRLPLAPRHLYYFDSANFALALEKFDPALHQPQPPGYPLFVALTRLIHFFVPRPEQVFLIAGLMAAFAATALILVLAKEMFGRTAGILAATLLASNPAFWFGGITNEIRVFLALSATAVALLAWRAYSRPEQPLWLYGAFAALGVGAGFRPVQGGFLLLFVLWVWWSTGHSVKRLLISLAAMALTVTPWLAATIIAVGGVDRFVFVLWQYAQQQFSPTSAAFGAAKPAAFHMFEQAVVWNFLGAVAWFWAVPLVDRQRGDWRKIAFLAVLFFPPFLFSAFIHIGDPDQALGTIPVLSVAGGAVLARWAGRWSGKRVLLVATGVVAVHALVFFYPPGRIARASSFRAAADVNRLTSGALDAIGALQKMGPLTIVHSGSSVASRQIAYYFPEDYVVVLPENPGEHPQIYYQHAPLSVPAGTEEPLRPGSRAVVCLMPWNVREVPGFQKEGSVFYRKVSDTPIRVGDYSFSAGSR